jgi:CRISPR-associated endonuclease Cas1
MNGFYHIGRASRPALALDAMEPLRPLLADSAVLAALNRGEMEIDDFRREDGAVLLNEEGRKKVIRAYERRMDSSMEHGNKSVTLRKMISVNIRDLAENMAALPSKYRALEIK